VAIPEGPGTRGGEASVPGGTLVAPAPDAWFQLLFEQSPEPMFIWRLDTLALIDVNEATLRQYGYTREEFLAMTVLSIRPDEDAAPLMQRLEEIDRKPPLFEGRGIWRHRTKDGTLIYVEISTVPLVHLGHRSMLVMAHDVTRHVHAEEALRATQQRYQALFQSDLAGMFVSKPEGRLQACNLAFARLLGFGSVLEALECDLTSLYPSTADRDALLDVVRRGGTLTHRRGRLVRRDGTVIDVWFDVAGVFDRAGKLVECIGHVRSVEGGQP
jgi:PAS domain S-box-containing protein